MLDGFTIPAILKCSLKNGGDFADIFCEYVSATSVVCEDGKIEHIIAGVDVGAGVRTIANSKTAYAYTNRLTDEGLMEVAEAVSCATRGSCFEQDINLMRKTPESTSEAKHAGQEVSLDDKVALVKRANQVARSIDNRIKQVKVVYRDALRRIATANTNGEIVYDERVATLFVVQVIVAQDDLIQTGYEPRGACMGFELFQDNSPGADCGNGQQESPDDARSTPGTGWKDACCFIKRCGWNHDSRGYWPWIRS